MQHNVVKIYLLPSLPTLTKYFIFHSVSAFSFYLKKKTPAKEKQTQGFAPRPRERRAAVHSLCCSVGSSAHSPVNSLRSNSTGNVAEAPPVADEARRCWRKTRSITPAPRAIGDYVLRGLCGGLQSKPFPRSSQLGCTTAARLLEACSSRFIKSLALPFLLFFPQLPLRRAVYIKILPKGFSSGRIAVLLCL